MIIITGSILTRPETHDEIVALGIEHSARSRAEPGCIGHNIHVDCENRSRLVFVEYWADAQAVRDHFKVPESGAFVRQATKLAAAPPEMNIYSAEEANLAG